MISTCRTLMALMASCPLVIATLSAQNDCGTLPEDSRQGSICYGYAMQRAIGFPRNSTAKNFRPYETWLPVDYFYGPVSGRIQEGDIVVWGPKGSVGLSGANAHAAYVAYVPAELIAIPLGDIRMTPSGVIGDITDELPTSDFSSILLDQVNGEFQGESIDQNMWTVHLARLEMQNEYKGIYRLRDEKKCVITFDNNFSNGVLFVGKDRTGNYLNATSTPIPWRQRMNGAIPAKVKSPQDVESSSYSFNPSEGWKVGFQNPTFYSPDSEITVVVGSGNQKYTASYYGGSAIGGYVTFENWSDTIGVGSIISVNGVNRFSRTDQFPSGSTTATAFQTLFKGRVHFTFSQWKLNGAFYSSNRTIAPTVAGNYRAIYTFDYVVPPADLSLRANNENGTLISWTKIAGSFIKQIDVWRQVRENKQITSPAQVIATLPPTSTQFIDGNYTPSDGWTGVAVDYDVRPQYRVNNTSSGPFWFSMFAESDIIPGAPDDPIDSFQSSVPSSYGLSAFPNPFNPTTKILYSLVNTAYVEMSVFDIGGRLISQLRAATEVAGTHYVHWNATSDGGHQVPSGIYIVRMLAVPEDTGIPIRFSQRLIVMK